MRCPICGNSYFSDFLKYPAYKVCLVCNLCCQENFSEKVWEGPEENYGKGPGRGHLMSQEEMNVNINLANALFQMFLPSTVLDIGSKYPVFLHNLKDRAEVLGIDGMPEIVKYGEELEVPVINDDFESMDIEVYKNKFDLITVIHTFEHFYNPLETLKKVFDCLSSRGVLFMRIPNLDVEGIDRDFTEHHLTIHPYVYSRQALQILSEKLGYEIFRVDDLGLGQSDFYFRKRKDKFTLSVCMIVKDEEKNITDCLESIKNVADEFVIVDTGSTDKTKEVVSKYTSNIFDFKWIDDFAAARNFSLSKATGDFVLWCFHPDTKICSKKGYIPIKEIKVNDRVLTHTGKFKRVCKLYKRLFKGDLFKVTTNLKEEFIATGNHKFYSCKEYRCKTGIKFCKPNCKKQYSKRYLKKYGKLSRQCKQGYKDYKFQYNEIQSLGKGDLLCLPMLKEVIDTVEDNRGLYNKYFYKDEKYIYYQIKSIEKIPYEGFVHNLEIEEDKTYVAGFALCHNCDADDVVLNPEDILPLLRESFDAQDFNIVYGNDNFSQARLFRNYRNIRFAGRVHEYPVLDGVFFKWATDLPTPQRVVAHQRETKVNVRHKTEKHSTEDRSERNHRILRKELEEDPYNSRTLFYLGNALKELKRYDEAIETYRKYLDVSTWVDERWMAQKYIGCIFQWQGEHKEAIDELKKALEIDGRWAETYYYIGEGYFFLKEYSLCIEWMLKATEKKLPFSPLWKEISVYEEAPYRYIFASYDQLGDHEKALHYCKIACEKKPDDEWLRGRSQYFEGLVEGHSKVIECFRQGALGDCLMTTAALRGLKEKDPGCFIRYVTHEHSMRILEGNKFIDDLVTESKDEHAQKIYFCYPDKDAPRGDEGYPDRPLNRHLVKIFNECAGLPENSLEMECTLSEKEESVGRSLRRTYKKYLTVHIKSGWSAYKDWYNDRWELVIEKLFERGYVTVQLGHKDDSLLRNTVDFRGHTVKEAVSAIKYADVHMGIDSFTNHTSATVFAPSVILFGSTSPTGSGYDQNINIYKDLPCQPCYREYKSKDPCPHGKKCMNIISVDEVLKAVMKQLERGL